VEVCVLVPVRMDGDSRVGIVGSSGIVYNWNLLLSTSVIKDAKDGGDSNNERK